MPDNPEMEGQYSDLSVRFVTGVILAAVALGVLWLDGVLLGLFASALAAMMMGELMAIVQKDRDASRLVRLCLVAGAAYVGLAASLWPLGAAFLALLVFAMAFMVGRDLLGFESSMGYLAICLAAIAICHLRDLPAGFWVSMWIIASVVASDTGGYFAGRLFGGAKLWPSISPKKTWSGAAGSVVAAAVVSIVFALVLSGNVWIAVWLGIVFSIVGILGDLAESAMKRRYGVKDAGRTLPGHGGLLDRFDGLIAVLPFALILDLLVDLPRIVGFGGLN